MNRLGLGVSIALIAVGVWLVWWYDPRFRPAAAPWGGMCAISLGLIGVVMCVLDRITGSALNIGLAPHPAAGFAAAGEIHQTDNKEGTPTMSGKFDEMKGRAKEAAGDVTGDDSLKNEGKKDKAEGQVKQKVDDAKNWVEDKVDKARDKVD